MSGPEGKKKPKRMKKLYTFLLLLSVLRLAAQPYGNEWINYSNTYFKFKVGDVQIDYAFTNLANQSYPLYTNVFSLRVDLRQKQKKGVPAR